MYSFSKFEHDWIMPERRYIEPLSEEYRVFVNGKEIPVYTCRISRYPFNRLWPGYQRAIEQTMLASFVNIISDEKVNIKIVPNNYCENIKISPLSKEIKYEKNSSGFSLWADTGSQLVVNAENGLAPLYIFSSQPVEDPGSEEATYYFGPGVHFPGKITLSDNESVYIDKDALVFGCVYAENAENIKIFGNGILDDSGEERFCGQGYEPYTNGNVKFYDCKNLKIEGVLMRNSAMWCVNFFHCIDVVADNI